MLFKILLMEVILIDNQYFANIIYYKNIVNCSNIIIEQYDEHQKKSFCNRCAIFGANGQINLSIPLEKGRSQKTISRDLRISNDENWQLRHWRSIVSCYNNSPWFKFISDNMADIYFTRFEFLLDWNLACLDWTLRVMKLEFSYSLTSEWVRMPPPGISDFRNMVRPGKPNGERATRYPQVFENKFGFIPGLSILDLICCEGPKGAALLLKNGS
jgi:hypothetical protein